MLEMELTGGRKGKKIPEKIHVLYVEDVRLVEEKRGLFSLALRQYSQDRNNQSIS